MLLKLNVVELSSLDTRPCAAAHPTSKTRATRGVAIAIIIASGRNCCSA